MQLIASRYIQKLALQVNFPRTQIDLNRPLSGPPTVNVLCMQAIPLRAVLYVTPWSWSRDASKVKCTNCWSAMRQSAHKHVIDVTREHARSVAVINQRSGDSLSLPNQQTEIHG